MSNAASTGGAGVVFEHEVQASFVALMATGGYAPALPTWPIVRVALQTKIDGYHTDDCLVRVEQPGGNEFRHLLCQIKRQISVRTTDTEFRETITSAWADFTNPTAFRQGRDVIALVTGPLTATDGYTLHWLTAQAREFSANEFYTRINQARMGPTNRGEKLGVIRSLLTAANGNAPVDDVLLHAFLCDFHVLGFDFWGDKGVVVSLLHSHLSAEAGDLPPMLWAQVVHLVAKKNTRGGAFELGSLPPELERLRASRRVVVQPAMPRVAFAAAASTVAGDHLMAFLAITGQWDQRSNADMNVVARIFDRPAKEVIEQVQAARRSSPGLLIFDDGIWRVSDRQMAWVDGAGLLSDEDIKRFSEAATMVLSEDDPGLSLAPEERHLASMRGLTQRHSDVLRRGLAEGLALIGAREEELTGCSTQGKHEVHAAIRGLLSGTAWERWASLEEVLPFIAEASPRQFLGLVDEGLRSDNNVFQSLFAEERSGTFGRTYMTGLLWALESLAWATDTFNPVVLLLAELAGIDPGGTWGNRPGNSLVTLLLPWYPQTLADWSARTKALRSVAREEEGVAFSVASRLLPNQTLSSSMSHRPVYLPVDVPDEPQVSEHYSEEIGDIAELVVELSMKDKTRLPKLVDLLAFLPRQAFEAAIARLDAAAPVLEEGERIELWKALRKTARRHRRFASAKWALPSEAVSLIEQAEARFEPADTALLLRLLFTGPDAAHIDDHEDWAASMERLQARRTSAVAELLSSAGLEAVFELAKDVDGASEVGYALMQALAGSDDAKVVNAVLSSDDAKLRQLGKAFVHSRTVEGGWAWLDGIDLAGFPADVRAILYAALPFGPDAWTRASVAGTDVRDIYWKTVVPRAWKLEDGDTAIRELVRVGRAWHAVELANALIHMRQPAGFAAMAEALLAADSMAPVDDMPDGYAICEVIKALQQDPASDKATLATIEWRYLQALDRFNGATPTTLWTTLSTDASFAISAIRIAYKSDRPGWKAPEAPDGFIENTWRLLHHWREVPGLVDGMFHWSVFKAWFDRLMDEAKESGHVDVAQMVIGKLLAHAPADPDGFWINRNLAGIAERREFGGIREAIAHEYFNLRGTHWVDPSGQAEFELEDRYRKRADESRAEGFPRLGEAIQNLADTYREDGRRLAARHRPPGDSPDELSPENGS